MSPRPRPARLALALLLMSGWSGCAAPEPAPPQESSGTDRSAEVVSGLAHPIEIIGRPPIRMALEERLEGSGATGVSIAVVRAGRLDWAQGFGVLSVETGIPVSPSTLFQAASISKPVAALATLRLVETGTLDLDQDVNAVLATWQVPANRFTAEEPVTIRRILSHSAGFTNGSVGSYAEGEPVPSLVQALRGVPPSTEPPATVDYLPGSRAVYSGGGYSVLQQLLIDATGKEFEVLMADTVLRPLRMQDSTFVQPLPPELADRAAVGHDASGKPVPGRWETLPEMAAGGLWSTTADLALLAVALHAAWTGDGSGILSPEMLRTMMTPVIDSRGLGFEVDRAGGRVRYRHTGSNAGYRSIIVGYPETGDAAVILANGDGAGDLRHEILRSIARVYGWPGFEPVRKSVIEADAALLRELEGVYDYGGGYTTTITLEDGRLHARLRGGRPVPLFCEEADRFFSLEGVTYGFVRDGGAVRGLTAELGGETVLPARRR